MKKLNSIFLWVVLGFELRASHLNNIFTGGKYTLRTSCPSSMHMTPLSLQGSLLGKFLEIVPTIYVSYFPQYLKLTKVHAGDGVHQKLR
jgi:hypothetical protein